MKDIARDYFEEACILTKAGKFNGAASRLYYALYRAIVAIFEERGIKQSDLTPKVDPENHKYWLHEVVRNFAPLAGVERRDASFVRDVWVLRRRADYEVPRIKEADIRSYLRIVKRILADLEIETCEVPK